MMFRILASEEFIQRIELVGDLKRRYGIEVIGRTMEYPISLYIDENTCVIIKNAIDILNQVGRLILFLYCKVTETILYSYTIFFIILNVVLKCLYLYSIMIY